MDDFYSDLNKPMHTFPFLTGAEVAVKKNVFNGYGKLGMLTNDAAIINGGHLSRSWLLQQGVPVVRLFSPEHGIKTTGADGEAQNHGIDYATRLDVISMYYEHTTVHNNALDHLDGVIIDLPDAGVRFYTYLWSMTHMMEACAAADIPVFILDRPNPLGAKFNAAEGPMLDEKNCASFIGRWNIPVKHGCTLGELANWFAVHKIKNLKLEVVPMENYNRNYKSGYDYAFVPTSPALQRWQAVHLYPGTCLLEGVNVNEGRGTPRPFECFGAPWLDTGIFLDSFPHHLFSPLRFSVTEFIPDASHHKDILCKGLLMQMTTPMDNTVAFGITLLETLQKTHAAYLQQRPYVTLANPTGLHHLDRLTGVFNSFSKISAGEKLTITPDIAWMDSMKDCLLYA